MKNAYILMKIDQNINFIEIFKVIIFFFGIRILDPILPIWFILSILVDFCHFLVDFYPFFSIFRVLNLIFPKTTLRDLSFEWSNIFLRYFYQTLRIF